MWKINSKTWGILQAESAYDSPTFSGMVTVHAVTRDGKPMWEKAYLPLHDIKTIIPPSDGDQL